MKKKIFNILVVFSVLVISIFHTPIKTKCADLDATLFNFNDNTYYLFGLDKIDTDALQGGWWNVATVTIKNTQQWGDVLIYIDIKRDYSFTPSSVPFYTIQISVRDLTDLSNIYDTYTFEIDHENEDSIIKHFILLYNYVDIVNVGTNRFYFSFGMVSDGYINFIDNINFDYELQYNKQGSTPYLQLRQNKYNYMLNDYCEVEGYYQGDSPTLAEIREALKNRINYFFENGVFYGKYYAVFQQGYNQGQLNPITADWFETLFSRIQLFLNLQILPNITFGTLLSIPVVLGLLRLVLFIWRNEG